MFDRNLIPTAHYFNLGDTYTGACGGMRYRIAMKKTDDGKLLEGAVWPEPFCYDKTADARKTIETFEYSQEGVNACADWIAAQYDSRKEEWKNSPTLAMVEANW
ncbi:MAG: GNAT family acetyltransferase [Butyricicoccus sp.]|nr:GNAT family acetyltransferase [Butyricicoccus sp.]MBQ8586347.1 GNAT family acetyltransferase [Butyricicoccus sp.]